jgi:hypothetical protein
MSNGSGATEARDAVRTALALGYKPVWQAGKDYALAYQQATTVDDLVEAMARAVDVVMAAAHLVEVASAAEKNARAELARVMQDAGCHQVTTATLTAYLTKRKAYVIVDDASAIPPSLLHQPPPVPDKAAIKDALEAGRGVPGASLITPNDMSLAIRSRK